MSTSYIKTEPEFINLNNRILAEYLFIYNNNDSTQITDLNLFNNKHQLAFKEIENRNQQLNLMFVDSVFPNILADLTVEVFLNKITSFNAYIQSNPDCVNFEHDAQFYKYKFYNYMNLLLYSDIATNSVFNGELNTNKVWCLKNKQNPIEFYSIYEQSILQWKLLEELKLEIDLDASAVLAQEVKLALKIGYQSV